MRAGVLVVTGLLAGCSWRVQVGVDLTRHAPVGEDALAAYATALEQYCVTGQLARPLCDQQRAELARVPHDRRAVIALDRALDDAAPAIARHLRGLIASLRPVP
jgi:hypothetical protein